VAAIKGHVDLAIGNVVGSNIFNIFWVIGLTRVILPLPVDSAIQIDMLVCIGATAILFTYMFFGKKYMLSRAQGASFVAMYAGYLIYLIARG
jgi:cation:H+ antiporter